MTAVSYGTTLTRLVAGTGVTVRILIVSSWVGFGHVGLSAAVPALHALGHEASQLPTTILSNHPGWPFAVAHPVPPPHLDAMLDAIDENGWLGGHDAVLIGYLPSAEHVDVACRVVARTRVRAPVARVIVDPILGDAPKGLYVPEAVADAIRTKLVPAADLITPNAFELERLNGKAVRSLDAARDAARALLDHPDLSEVMVTSAPVGPRETGVLSVGDGRDTLYKTPLREAVPHGVGDVFSAFIAAGYDVGTALGFLQSLIEGSLGAPHLRIVEHAPVWTRAAPLALTPMPGET